MHSAAVKESLIHYGDYLNFFLHGQSDGAKVSTMARLKNRNHSIPGGLRFLVAKTQWKPYPHSSFETIVRGLQDHLRVNPAVAKELGWATDYESLAIRVDEYNAALCLAHGWTDFIHVDQGGPPSPKAPARSTSLSQSVKRVAGGVALIADWLGKGGVAVAKEVSTARAKVCVSGVKGKKCPRNNGGNWTDYFTVPASATIRKLISLRNDMNLSTPDDDALGVCTACDCPLKLKVHTPIEHIRSHITEDQKAALVPECWILAELGQNA